MTVVVVFGGAAVDEVDKGQHAPVGQIGMLVGGDARIDEGHRDTRAGVAVEARVVDAVAQVYRVGVHRDRRQRVVLTCRAVEMHAMRVRAVRQRRELRHRHLIEHVAVDDRQLAAVRITLERERQVGVVLERHDHVGGVESQQAEARGPFRHVGVHLVAIDPTVRRAWPNSPRALAMTTLGAGIQGQTKQHGRDGHGSENAAWAPHGLRPCRRRKRANFHRQPLEQCARQLYLLRSELT